MTRSRRWSGYYVRLERRNLTGISESVLAAITSPHLTAAAAQCCRSSEVRKFPRHKQVMRDQAQLALLMLADPHEGVEGVTRGAPAPIDEDAHGHTEDTGVHQGNAQVNGLASLGREQGGEVEGVLHTLTQVLVQGGRVGAHHGRPLELLTVGC